MNIIYYTETLDNGGVEKLMEEWIIGLKEKYNFDIVTCKIINNEVRHRFQSLGCQVFEIGCHKYNYIYKYVVLKKLLKQHRYSIIHLNTMFALEWWTLKVASDCGIKIRIAHSHNTAAFDKNATKLIHKVSQFFLRKYSTDYWSCSKAAFNSLFGVTYKKLNNGYGDKVQIIKNSIDTEKFKFSSKTRSLVRYELSIDDDTILFLSIGRISEQKNYNFLLDVYREIEKELIKMKRKSVLYIVGGGNVEELQRKARNNKMNVVFTGVRNDVYRMLNGADCYLCTSIHEGFSLTTLEAQNNGLLCVVSFAVPKEVIITDRVKQIELGNKKKWSQKVLDCVLKPAPHYPRESYAKDVADAGYDNKSAILELNNHYERLIKGALL